MHDYGEALGGGVNWSPNAVVGYNLRRIRERRGWTHEQAAERLEPYLGVRWKRSAFSLAEKTKPEGRVRQFSADEIVAMSLAFEVPLWWWFIPPVGKHGPEAIEAGKTWWRATDLLAELILDRNLEVPRRLNEVFESLAVNKDEFLELLGIDASRVIRAAIQARIGDIEKWISQLSELQFGLESARDDLGAEGLRSYNPARDITAAITNLPDDTVQDVMPQIEERAESEKKDEEASDEEKGTGA